MTRLLKRGTEKKTKKTRRPIVSPEQALPGGDEAVKGMREDQRGRLIIARTQKTIQLLLGDQKEGELRVIRETA